MQAGEASFRIANLRCCEGKSYSGPIHIQPNTYVRAGNCNYLHPSLPEGGQPVIYQMNCGFLKAPKDLEVLIRERIKKICPLRTRASYIRCATVLLGA